jgi:hypothetical protein
MSEKKTAGTGEDKSDLDLVEEAFVGTHQEVPRPDDEDEGDSEGVHDGPPVPGNRSP